MSYILDALKKAEKERRRGTVPNLSTDQDLPVQKPKKRSLWFYILITVLLINAGIFFFWLSPWKSKETTLVAKGPAVVTNDINEKAPLKKSSDIKSNTVSESIPPKKTLSSVQDSAQKEATHKVQSTAPPRKPADTQQQKQTVSAPSPKEEPVPVPSTKEEVVLDNSSIIVQPQNDDAAVPPATTPNPPSTESPASDKPVPSSLPPPERFRLYDLKSLPSSVKERLPDINISVFVYSDDPSSRVVKINGHTVREGQELTDGLKVDEIVPDGVIFYYEDYRFRVGIK